MGVLFTIEKSDWVHGCMDGCYCDWIDDGSSWILVSLIWIKILNISMIHNIVIFSYSKCTISQGSVIHAAVTTQCAP